METYVVRVWMPDRPGALGQVASRIGAVRGDVVGIDILERGAGRAIDELVVRLPDASVLELLVAEIKAVDGVDVEDVRPAADSLRDPRLDALETAAMLVGAMSCDELLSSLVTHAQLDFGADWAAVVDLEEPCRPAAIGEAPPAAWLQAFVEGSRSSARVAAGEAGPDDVAWAPLPSARLSIVLGRTGRPLRARERRQVAALARIADTRWVELVAHRSRAQHPSGPSPRSRAGHGRAPLRCRAMAVVIAVDAGTTGVRSFAVDEAGRPAGWSYREFPQHYPRPGWVEHDAEEIWAAVQATLHELTATLDQPVAALGITDQRETVVAWDRRTGAPRHRAIVWQDRRTAGRCEALQEAGHLPLVRRLTGLVLDPYFSATKAAWLLAEGGVTADAHLALGTVDAWLLWKLTGGASFATDTSNASRTSLFDIDRLAWSDELCELFGVPRGALPEVRPSSGRLGVTVEGVGVPAGTPVSGIAGDQQAALFGQACTEPGMTKNTYGTGSFVLMNVGEERPPPVEGLLTTVAWSLEGRPGATYALEGSIFATGAAVQWLRDGLGVLPDAPSSEALAASVPDTAGVYLVPAFTGLGSPWWDPHARGAVLGITRGTTAAHLARATLASIAYQTRDVVTAMTAASGHPVTSLRADGGASANNLLLQLQADQLQVPVARPAIQETTALGAAWLAGLAEGVWSSLEEVGRQWRLDREVHPAVGPAVADRGWEGWRRAVERSLAWEHS